MDKLSIIGIVLGFSALLGGNLFEGGNWQSLLNGPAALIVIGGTFGAAILQTSSHSLKRAGQLFIWVFKPPKAEFNQGMVKIIRWASAARREGLLGLETLSETEVDAFAQKGLQLLVDGSEPEAIRQVLEADMIIREERDIEAVQLYEGMGGYAPTIGILGAVIGLIHVMRNLEDPAQLGPGIAVAFVATIYGVAFANLFLLPVANKLKMCISTQSRYCELMIAGIVSIAEGENPRAIEIKLTGYLH